MAICLGVAARMVTFYYLVTIAITKFYNCKCNCLCTYNNYEKRKYVWWLSLPFANTNSIIDRCDSTFENFYNSSHHLQFPIQIL